LTAKSAEHIYRGTIATIEAVMSEIRKLLDENAVLPLWPETGKLLKLKRGSTYAAAERGDIEVVEIGKLKRVSTAWLKRKLGLSESGI
jgi:hypothetical protein